MQYPLLLTAAFALLVTTCVGQSSSKSPDTDLKVTYSPSFNAGDSYKFLQFVEMTDGNPIAIFSRGKNEYTSFKIDLASMEVESYGSLELKDSKDKAHFIAVGNRLLLPYFQTSQENQTNCLFIQEIDPKTMKAKGEPFAVDCLEGKDYYKNFENSFAATKVSPDGSKLLVYYKLPEPEGGGKLFRFSVYDDQLSQIWRKDVPTKIEEGILKIGDAEWFMADHNYGVAVVYGQGANHSAIGLDNFGNVFFWSRVDFGRDHAKFHRFQTFWSKVNAKGIEHIHMHRGSGTQSTRSYNPELHISNRKATLVEYFADEGRGGFAFMVASTENAADGFHYAQWSDQYKPETFYEHLFTLEEVTVPATRGQYNKIRDKEHEDKSIMLQPLGHEILSVSGTDDIYIKLYQTIHRRYSTLVSAQAVLSYHLDENEDLTYLGGFAYSQGEHLNNYTYLGVKSMAGKDGIYHIFNDNKRNLSSKFDPREEVNTFFTEPNPVSLVPEYLDKDSFKSGKRQQLMTSKQLGDLPLDIDKVFRSRSGCSLVPFLHEGKYNIVKLEPK